MSRFSAASGWRWRASDRSAHIAHDLGMRKKVRQHEADTGKRPELPTSAEREEIRRLCQENYELRRANEILKSAIVRSAR